MKSLFMISLFILFVYFELPMGSCLFFFQAEDGKRYRTVTGVQTCALPILAAGDGAVGDGDAVPRGPDGDGEGLTRIGAGEKVANHWARGITGTSIGTLPARRKCRTT